MDKAKKKQLKRYLTWGAIAALVLVLTIMPLLAKSEAEADGPVASILSAQVERKDIPQTLHGGGTLEALGQEDVNIPTGVKIKEFLVNNGDTVQAGDPVALVDKVSVMGVITQVNESMDYLLEELESSRSEQVAATIYATTGGRVKRVFAEPGDDVQETMLTHGALALLSIDGLMAVKLDADSPVATGDSVTVARSGGQITGRVESNLNGQVVVTVEDAGYGIGESVTVSQTDGTLIGEGKLYVHNAWKAVAYSGTIGTVSVQQEQVLTEGAAMFTLTDRDYEGQLKRRASQHREYEALLQRLLAMYETGYITAPCAGTVSGVDENSSHLLSETDAPEAQPSLLSGDNMGTVKLMLLSNKTCNCVNKEPGMHAKGCAAGCCNGQNEDECEAGDGNHTENCIEFCQPKDGMTSCSGKVHKDDCIAHCKIAKTANDTCNAKRHYDACIKSCVNAGAENTCKDKQNPHYASCIESCGEAQTAGDSCDATGAHKSTCIRSCVRADVDGVCKPNQTGVPHYVDCIESCTGEKYCPATKHLSSCQMYGMTFTATVAKVDSVGNTELVVYWDASGTSYPVEKSGSGWRIIGNFDESLLISAGTLSVGNARQFKKGDIILSITGTKNGESNPYTVAYYKSSSASSTVSAETDHVSTMVGGFTGSGNYTGTVSDDSEDLYDLKGSPLMTVTQEAGYAVELSMDERDIHKVQVGQEVTIRVEAVRGQQFSGSVTRVGAIGTHSGSTGKFQVRVETGSIPGSLPGMSSMVTIHLDTREDVLSLPVAALSQVGAKTVVYTALDQKTGEPTAPREITTGISDGETVEVMGLEEGTKVYYAYYDVLEIDDSAEEPKYSMF